MTQQELIQKLQDTGRILPQDQTARNGLILPNGRVFAVRVSDPTESHSSILNEIGLSMVQILSQFNVVRKMNNTFYEYHYVNSACIGLIEADLLLSRHADNDPIVVDDHFHSLYRIQYGEFSTTGKLPKKLVVESLWL